MLTLIMDNYCKAQHCVGVDKMLLPPSTQSRKDDEDGEDLSAGWLLPVIHFHRGTT